MYSEVFLKVKSIFFYRTIKCKAKEQKRCIMNIIQKLFDTQRSIFKLRFWVVLLFVCVCVCVCVPTVHRLQLLAVDVEIVRRGQ